MAAKIRKADKAVPQGNDKPELVKAGKPKIEESLNDFGLSLISQFSFSIPSGAGDDSEPADTGGFDLGEGVSFTKLLLAEAMEGAGDSLTAFVRSCEATSKALKAEAKSQLEKVEEYYLAWAAGFPMASNSILLVNSKGSSLTLDKAEFERSTKALLYAMGKLSNNALFGKPASEGKAPVKSVFQSPGKVAKLAGFSGENGTHTALAEVNHLILDKGGYIQKSLELFGTLARQLNARNPESAALTYRTLKGNSSDSRFGFEDWAIRRITQARIYGMFAAQFDEQARQAQKAIEDKRKYSALSEADRKRVEDFKRNLTIARNKAEDNAKANIKKTEYVADSNVPSALPETPLDDLTTTLNRLKRELAEEMLKPETSEDSSIQLRSPGKVRYLESQIAGLTPDTEPDDTNEPAEDNEAGEPAELTEAVETSN